MMKRTRCPNFRCPSCPTVLAKALRRLDFVLGHWDIGIVRGCPNRCPSLWDPDGPVDPGRRTGSPALLAGWRLKRPGSDETIFPGPRSRPEMNAGYQKPRIKRRGFELFSNDQSQ
jgi:hypothetical protein